MRLWLDDVRPAPVGWVWVKTVDEAIACLQTGGVEEASFDHDLGRCAVCADCVKCACRCHLTGTTLVDWMAAENIWPRTKPRVHSSNPVGRERMRQTIDRYWSPPGND